VEAQRQFLTQTLHARVVENATYDKQGKQPCDDNTRVDVLTDIGAWIYDVSARSQNVLWLTGDPDSGKSAIAASITRECKDSAILWAQYFINRNNADTTDPRSFFYIYHSPVGRSFS
jgi:DNA replication protein DnaC